MNKSEGKNKAHLVVLSGPSGVGKGMMIDWMLKMSFPDFYDKYLSLLIPVECLTWELEVLK